MALRAVVSERCSKPSTVLLDMVLDGKSTRAVPGPITVFPVRNLTDVLLLDYVLSFTGVN